jgi:hypothetical protein
VSSVDIAGAPETKWGSDCVTLGMRKNLDDVVGFQRITGGSSLIMERQTAKVGAIKQ